MRVHTGLAVLTALLFTSGCATSGAFMSGNATEVHLSEENYRIIATGVSGEAEAAYLLGVSGGWGFTMQTVALFRLEGDGLLYQAALRDLWRNFDRDFGPVEGRSLALVNVRYDSDAVNLLVYTKPRVSVVADVVEFVE